MDRDKGKPTEEPIEDFGALFEDSLKEVKTGEVVSGRVIEVSRDFVTVDIGYKSEGQIPISEFTDADGDVTVAAGESVDVYFESNESEQGGISLSRNRAEQLKVWTEVERAFNEEGTVEGTVVGRVKGGLKVDIGVSAFLPGSHADIRPARNLDRYMGQTGHFAILKFNRSRGNVVVSRRSVIEREREGLKEETLRVLEEGVILEGVVKNLTEYGAFIDLGGIDGLLHITDMSWGRVGHPSEVVNVADRVKVVVLKYDNERERVSLGMKQILPDPWTSVAEQFVPGMRTKGKVVSLTDYGCFVELDKGVEGLVHVSEMSWTKRVNHPNEVVKEGDEVDVQVLEVDGRNRRISLGLKQVDDNPWELVRVNHPIGSRVKGPVKNITDFGVFIEVAEGIDGLVHISDLHWTKKVRHPSDLYAKGDEVEAVVLDVDPSNERISLGVKQLSTDPWLTFQEKHPEGSKVHGKVSSVADFGVFVELEDGVDGLVHVSQLANERVDKPSDFCSVGDEIEAEVVTIDPKERRLGLSVKALTRTLERAEMETYLAKEREGAKFSFKDILGEDLPLDSEGRLSGTKTSGDD